MRSDMSGNSSKSIFNSSWSKETSEQRLNLSQSFNGLGWIMGPAIGGLLILGGDGNDPNKFASMTLPYMIIGTLVLLVAILFMINQDA